MISFWWKFGKFSCNHNIRLFVYFFSIPQCPECKKVDVANRRIYLNFADEPQRMKKIADELHECRLQVEGYSELLGEYEKEAIKRSIKLDTYEIEAIKLTRELDTYKKEVDTLKAEVKKLTNYSDTRRVYLNTQAAFYASETKKMQSPLENEKAMKSKATSIEEVPTKKRTDVCCVPIKKPKIQTRSSSRIRQRALADQTNKKQ